MKKPRVNKTTEQILAELQANTKFQKKMAFIKEEFYPALCEAATSIEDASILLEGFNTMMMQEFLSFMKEKTVRELNLGTKLDTMSDKFAENSKLLELFLDLSVFDAKEYIEGMKHEIEVFKVDELRERPLSSLKTKWIDEVQKEILAKQ